MLKPLHGIDGLIGCHKNGYSYKVAEVLHGGTVAHVVTSMTFYCAWNTACQFVPDSDTTHCHLTACNPLM